MAPRTRALVAFLAAGVAGCVSRPALPPSQAKLIGALAGCVRATQSHSHGDPQPYTSLCAANAFNTKGLIGMRRSVLLKFVGSAGKDRHAKEMSYPLSTAGAGSVGGPVVLTVHLGPDELVDAVWLVAVQ